MIHSPLVSKIAPLLIGAVTGYGAVVVDERTPVPLGASVAVGVFACTLVWWIGSKVQRLTDQLSYLGKRIDDLNKRIDKLPCGEPGCEVK